MVRVFQNTVHIRLRGQLRMSSYIWRIIAMSHSYKLEWKLRLIVDLYTIKITLSRKGYSTPIKLSQIGVSISRGSLKSRSSTNDDEKFASPCLPEKLQIVLFYSDSKRVHKASLNNKLEKWKCCAKPYKRGRVSALLGPHQHVLARM